MSRAALFASATAAAATAAGSSSSAQDQRWASLVAAARSGGPSGLAAWGPCSHCGGAPHGLARSPLAERAATALVRRMRESGTILWGVPAVEPLEAFWLVYGILNGLMSVIIWNGIALALGCGIFYAKMKWGR